MVHEEARDGADCSASCGINAKAQWWQENVCTSAWTRQWVEKGFPIW